MDIFFLVVWNERHSAPSGYGHSFHLLIWIVFTVQDNVVVTSYILVLWMHKCLRIFLLQLFSLSMNICTCILSNDTVFPQPEYKHIPKNITENTGKSFSEQSCNLCKWNLRSNFPFPYWLVFFSWSLLALGLTFWCQRSGLWKQLNGFRASVRKKTIPKCQPRAY